jgi:hypothetical protein
LLDAERVAEVRGGAGNIDRGSDLIALAALFREAWPTKLGPELLMALGARGLDDRSGALPHAREDRARAFTLLLSAYDDCQQAARYLRWKEGDVDEFAPSLRPKPRGEKGAPPESDPGQPVKGPDVKAA